MVFFAMLFYQFTELLSVAFRLAGSHSLYILQFLFVDRIHHRHLFQRYVLENHVWRNLQFTGDLAAEILQHGEEFRVENSRTCHRLFIIAIIFKLGIHHDHERLRRLHETPAGGSQSEKSVILDVFLQIAGQQRLTDDRIPYLRIFVFSGSELLQFVMLMVFLVVSSPAPYKVDDILLPEVLLQHLHRLKGYQKLLLPLDLLLGMQAVVTHFAVVLRVFLTEIMQQHLPPADRRLGIGFRLLQQLPSDVLLGDRFPLHELLQLVQVFLGIEHDTDSFLTVASGTSRLLVITFKALRDIIMDHKAHVGFVDSHSEGDRRHDHVQILHQEVVLRLRPRLRVETCMIRCGLDVIGLQDGGQFLHLLARQAVDDTALASMLLDELDDLPVGIVVALLRPYLVIQVRTVEGALELHAILDAQTAHDVRTHLVGSRRRKRNDRSHADRFNRMAYLAVLRTEVMSPFRDTVCLVNGVEADLY